MWFWRKESLIQVHLQKASRRRWRPNSLDEWGRIVVDLDKGILEMEAAVGDEAGKEV